MKKILKKIFLKVCRKIILLIKYSPFNLSLFLRIYFYKFLFNKLGKKCMITDGVSINFPENISFGNRVSLHQNTLLDSLDEIIIGDNVAIGSHCILITSSHNFADKTINIKDQGIIKNKIIISDNVWIGSRVTILKGVSIGKNSIIGANSLVNKDIPENVVAVGAPCKVIKSR